MMDEIQQRTSPLRIFLCHSSGDKPEVRNLYQRLSSDGFDPWLDEEDLLPGQKWKVEIPKAVRTSDVVIVCLSHKAINKSGYVQKEIKFALDKADEQPEDTISLIPLKLEECDVPERLQSWQWVNLFEEKGYERLMSSLSFCAEKITPGSNSEPNLIQGPEEVTNVEENETFINTLDIGSTLENMEFALIQPGESDIFLSYKSKDRAKAQIIAKALESHGYSVWWDRIILPGQTFEDVIEEELTAANCIVVLWSKESVKSKWVRTEASEGKRRKIFIPVLIEDVTPPLAFRLIEAAKLIDWDGTKPNPEFDLLVGSVSRKLGKVPAPETEIQKTGDQGEEERKKRK